MPTPEGKVKITIDVSEDIRVKLKTYCAGTTTTMTSLVEELIKNFLKEKGAI